MSDVIEIEAEVNESVGGTGGVAGYHYLPDKPSINGVTLVDNKSAASLGLVDDVQQDGESVVDGSVASLTPFIGGSTSSTVNKAGLVPKPPSIEETGQWHILTDNGWKEATPQPDSSIPWATKYSPTFSGIPKAPTAAVGTNTTQIATTAFVHGEVLEVPKVYCGEEAPEDPNAMVWVDTNGDPYPMEDEIAEAVDEWVTAHPEAVTTVQDGAVSKPKLDNNLKSKIDLVDTNATHIANLDALVNNLATLQEGSTTGDAELIAARTVGSTTYQNLHTAIDTEFTNVKSAIIKTIPVDFSNAISGKYIGTSGYMADSSGFSYVAFPAEVGDRIVFNASGYLNYVTMIATYYNGTYYPPRVFSTDSDQHTYTYTITEEDIQNGEIVVYLCYDNAKSHSAHIERKNIYTIEETDALIENSSKEIISVDFSDAVNGKYVNNGGNLADSSGFAYATAEGKAGDEISFKATGYLNYVAMIASSNDGVSFNVLASSVDSSQHTYTCTLDEDSTVYFSYATNSIHEATITRIKYLSKEQAEQIIDQRIEQYDTSPQYLHLFNTIGIVGDSLSSGEVYPLSDNTPKDMYHWSWLESVCKEVGATSSYYSQGGLTAKGWCESAWRTQLLADEPKNAYYLALGTNDKQYFNLGSVTDTSANDTFAGWYKEVISVIHSHAPNAVIFCVSLYETNTTADSFSEMIESISDLYDYCYFVDYINNCAVDMKITGANTLYQHNWHFTGLGYIRAGETIRKVTLKTVADNLSDFKFFAYNQTE